jgi:hypothetical protein
MSIENVSTCRSALIKSFINFLNLSKYFKPIWATLCLVNTLYIRELIYKTIHMCLPTGEKMKTRAIYNMIFGMFIENVSTCRSAFIKSIIYFLKLSNLGHCTNKCTIVSIVFLQYGQL